MPFGSSVVEVRMKGFPDDWASIYFQSTYRSENTHLYFSVRLLRFVMLAGIWLHQHAKPAFSCLCCCAGQSCKR